MRNQDPPTAAQLIAALRTLIDRGHAAGLKVYCSTLTPFRGADYWTKRAETGRAAINNFLRGTGSGADSGCDAVIDQDTAVRDPSDTTRYRGRYDSGDHLHPDDTGMQAIADAVNLSLFD